MSFSFICLTGSFHILDKLSASVCVSCGCSPCSRRSPGILFRGLTGCLAFKNFLLWLVGWAPPDPALLSFNNCLENGFWFFHFSFHPELALPCWPLPHCPEGSFFFAGKSSSEGSSSVGSHITSLHKPDNNAVYTDTRNKIFARPLPSLTFSSLLGHLLCQGTCLGWSVLDPLHKVFI